MSPSTAPLVPLRIRLPYATESEFVARYGANLSRGGVFIATRAVKPEGMALAFEVVLKSGEVLLRGEAVVTGVQVDAAPGRTGMTLSFVRLDPASREALERVLAQRAAPAPRRLSELSKRIDAALASEDNPDGTTQAWPGADDVPPIPPSPQTVVPAPRSSDTGDVPPAPSSPPAVVSAPRSSETGDLAPRAAATPIGLADPLTPPPLPETPATMVEPVLGVELLDSAARVGAWSSTGPRAVSLPGGGDFPLLAAFESDGWLLGRSAAARPDAIPLFAPPSSAPAEPRSGEPTLTLQGHEVSARLLGAHLFAQLRQEVEAALGRPVRDVVLVVPSWFSYRDRLLVGEAARLGGLRPLQLLHATSAATAAFAHQRGLARKRVLALHAEAAHFEAAIIQVTGEDLEVISTRGALPAGEAVGLDRIAEVVQEVLSAAGASATSLDEVIRFGDPLAFARAEPRLAELLARALPDPLDPTAAVTGAALIGHAQAALAKGKHGGTVFEVLVSPLSLVQRDGTLRRVLEVGTRLPAEKALTVPLAASELLALVFCGGAAARYEEAEVIGAANVESGPMAGELSVRLTVDRNGQLGLSTAIGGGRPEPRPLSPAIDPTALLPLTLPVEPARKAGFLRGIAQKLSKG